MLRRAERVSVCFARAPTHIRVFVAACPAPVVSRFFLTPKRRVLGATFSLLYSSKTSMHSCFSTGSPFCSSRAEGSIQAPGFPQLVPADVRALSSQHSCNFSSTRSTLSLPSAESTTLSPSCRLAGVNVANDRAAVSGQRATNCSTTLHTLKHLHGQRTRFSDCEMHLDPISRYSAKSCSGSGPNAHRIDEHAWTVEPHENEGLWSAYQHRPLQLQEEQSDDRL